MTETWHRFEIFSGDPVRLRHRTFAVIRHTPKGVWLDDVGFFSSLRGEKFVLKDARKRFACPTVREAMESLLARQQRRKRILSAQLQDTEEAITLASAAVLAIEAGMVPTRWGQFKLHRPLIDAPPWASPLAPPTQP